jgi:glutathione S-transferase
MSSLKPITLRAHDSGPNAWKVASVLEELRLPYEIKYITFPDMKKPDYESINPNGRVPSIQDPNTDTTLWESGAIIEYLLETYDSDKRHMSFAPGTKEYFLAKQWLFYQVSGQGPYWGQAVGFAVYHPESLPSALDRYIGEIKRVLGVLNKFVDGKQYLVGDRFSYADSAFTMRFVIMPVFAGQIDVEEEFPNVLAWLERIKERPAVKRVHSLREEAMAANKK